MSYTLNYGPGGNSTISVPDGQSGTVANLTFPGRNFSGYGSPVDQNFLSLAENFASANTAGPQYAIAGQLWYDIANTSNAISNSYQGIKINTSTTATANWTNIVTFDKPGTALNSAGAPIAINPNNISNIGTLSATVGNITTINSTTVTGSSISASSASITAATIGNATSNTVVSASGITVTGGTITTPTANVTSLNVTGNVVISGSSITVTSSSSTTIFDGDVTVNGKFNAINPTNTNVQGLSVSSPIFSVGKASGNTVPEANANTLANQHAGVRMVYYTQDGNSLSIKNAFMGFIPNTSTFYLASDVNAISIANSIVANAVTAGSTLIVGAITANANIAATDFNGKLSNGTSNVSIPLSGGNINLHAGNASAGNATVNIIGFDKITGTSTTWSAANAALAVTGAGFISGNLRVAGNIYGNLISPAGSTANIPAANIATANISGTATINTVAANAITTQNVDISGTASTAQLTVSGSATVAALTVGSSVTTQTINATGSAGITALKMTSTNISATGGLDTSSATITGSFTLTGNSTLEATYSADLAERHHADTTYPTGTVMAVGGINEITAANEADRVLGVVSDTWAYLMNGGAGPQETHPGVAYVGRVPVRVVGPINKHDEVSPFANGVATSSKSNSFGWALESNLEAGEKLVLCIVK